MFICDTPEILVRYHHIIVIFIVALFVRTSFKQMMILWEFTAHNDNTNSILCVHAFAYGMQRAIATQQHSTVGAAMHFST